jgi:tRNA dimethylallyltransferase
MSISVPKNNLKSVIVLGPTATGKSELGVKLAINFNGEIISADSRQVYRGLDIGSNKITEIEMRNIKHHLIDVASPKRNFSVARFQKLSYQAIDTIIKKGKTPIIVGGSPFYIYAITEGWSLPKVKENFKLRKSLSTKNTNELLSILKEIDHEYAKKIDGSNPRRLIRAIEIAEALGSVPPLESDPLPSPLFLGLSISKDNLKQRIEKRLDKRMKIGLIQEVDSLRSNQKLSWKRLEGFGLEYRWVAFYLQNKISKSEMIEGIIRDSLKLAKKQMVWFKKDPRIKWVENEKEAFLLAEEYLS